MAEYIEREALLKDIGETVLFSVRGDAELPTPEMRGANKVKDRIKSAPAADVVEVRHGEWIDYESNETYGCYESKAWYKCSCCGEDAYGRCDEDPWYSHPILSDYCPFCGAKMDGKGESDV